MNLPSQKIEIIIEKKKKELLLEELQKFGLVEIISADNTSLEDNSKLSELKFARSFLLPFKEKSGLVKSLVPQKGVFNLSELEDLSKSSEMEKIPSLCGKLEEEINSLNLLKEKLEKEIEVLKKVKDLPVSSSIELKNHDYLVGYLENTEDFLEDLKGKPFSFQSGGESSFLLIYRKEDSSFFKEIIQKYKIKEENIFWDKFPKESLAEKEKELEEINIETDIKSKEAQKLAVTLPQIEALIDFYTWENEKHGSMSAGAETINYFRIEAWIIKGAIPEIKKRIEKISSNFLIDELEISENDNPPVCLKNRGIMDSFGVVTDVYGLPKTDEPDPTPYLSLFFALFFGLALSDAGYGALLVLISYLAKKVLKEHARFFNLFIIGGIFTIVAGVLTGTLFGTDVFSGYKLLNPVEDPITALIFMFILGAFQIFCGLLIGMFWNLKLGRIKDALGAKGGPVVFFISVFLSFLTKNPVFAVIGAGLLFILNVLFSPKKGFLKLLQGFGALYGLVGYFSDILSYSRLLALGLATGIIAMVINMMAFLFKDMIPVPGINWMIAIGILVFGHTMNLLINVLGAFIHSARLQFVEFFSKFMEGGGKHFKPLNKKGRFVEIIN